MSLRVKVPKIHAKLARGGERCVWNLTSKYNTYYVFSFQGEVERGNWKSLFTGSSRVPYGFLRAPKILPSFFL